MLNVCANDHAPIEVVQVIILLSLLQVKKLKLSMNSKFKQNLCNDFFIFIVTTISLKIR